MFKKKTKKKQGIRALSATIDKETYKNVVAALDEALDDKCINIGLVGPCGCGKSSAVKTYLSERKRVAEGTVFVSFGDYLENKETDDGKRFTKAGVERSIVEQILFSRKASKTDGSRIDRVHDTRRKLHLLLVVIGAVLLVAFAFLAAFIWKSVGKLVENDSEPFTLDKLWSEFGFPIFLALAFVVVGLLFILYNVRDLKVKVSDVEIDCAKEEKCEKPVILNKYFDELLYFCDKNKIRLIVCEDIDRLKKLSRELFVDLRHLCICLNESYPFKRKRKLSFVYCTNDDVFVDKGEMQKFFDCVIPIKPVLNPSNRETIVSKVLKEVDGFEEVVQDARFLSLFSPFFSDMRLLLSTINEYRLLCECEDSASDGRKKQNTVKEKEQLMLLCLYHNLHPDKYEELLTDNNEYADFKKNCELSIERYRESLMVEQERMANSAPKEGLKLSNIQTLALAKAVEIASRHGGMDYIQRGDQRLNGWLVDEGFVVSFKNKDARLYSQTQNNYYRSATIKDVERVCEMDLYEVIEKPYRMHLTQKDEKIAVIKSEIESLGDPLAFAMEHPAEATIGAKITPLLRTMILWGYFDDSVIDSFLASENRNSVGSLAYVQRALIEKNIDLTLVKLTNVHSVVYKIPDFYFSAPEIINADILEYFNDPGLKAKNDRDLKKKKRLLDVMLQSNKRDVSAKVRRLVFADLETHRHLLERLLSGSSVILSDCSSGELDSEKKSALQKLVIFSAEKGLIQNGLSEVIARVWNDPIDDTEAKSLLKFSDEFEKSGFKYRDVSFAIGKKEVMWFITSTNAWDATEDNAKIILGNGISNMGDVRRQCADNDWCNEHGVCGSKLKDYIDECEIFPGRKPARSLFSLGLRQGDEIVYIKDEKVKATVYSEYKVSFEGQPHTLKAFLRLLNCKDYENEMDMFTFKGNKLSELSKTTKAQALTKYVDLV